MNLKKKTKTIEKTANISKALTDEEIKEKQEAEWLAYDLKKTSDSLKLEIILKEALKISLNNLQYKKFDTIYEMQTDDGSQSDDLYNVNVSIAFGKIFSKKINHLIIRRKSRNGVQINIYKATKNEFEQTMYRNQDGMTYLNDTIKDVNGDGKKDFLVHWYPSSGCCRRNVYNVYLQNEQGKFSKDYEFINPTFYPKEKIIRGVKYGYGADLYKYKWNNLTVDTIEFIKKDESNPNKFYITKKWDYNNPPIVKYRIIKKMPKEYENIDDIDSY
jgi:hypothetical protein